MFDLIRMDMRRIFRSKAVYAGLLLLAAAILISLVTLKYVTADEESIVNTTQEQISQILSSTQTDVLYSTVFNGGFFAITLSILTVLFLCSDFESGFAKNIFALRAKRYGYLFSKWLVLQMVSALYLLTAVVWLFLGEALFHLTFAASAVSDFVWFVLIFWLLSGAYIAQMFAVCMILRSKAAGIAAAILLPGGFAVIILSSLFGALGMEFPMDYTLYGCVQKLGSPIHFSDFCLPGGVCAAWLIVWMAAAAFALQKKDIA